MPRGPRQAGQKLKELAVQKALVSEVKKAVSPLAFKSQELQYTFLAEENVQYGRKVLRHSLKAYFDLIREVKPDLEFKSLKRHFSIIAKPDDKSLVSIKGLRGRQNLYNAKILSAEKHTAFFVSAFGFTRVLKYSRVYRYI